MGKTIKQEIENTKKETKMKTIKPNQTVKTILTVVITLVAIASLGGMFYLGMNYQQGIDAKVQSAVDSAVASKDQTVE